MTLLTLIDLSRSVNTDMKPTIRCT